MIRQPPTPHQSRLHPNAAGVPLRRRRGYTLIELLVVLSCIGLLLAIAGPRFASQVDRARETALRHNLAGVRDAIDKFHADRARYPRDLQELVTARYLRALPLDPVTDRVDSWVLIAPPNQQGAAVQDLHSGAPGRSLDGSPYASW